MNFNDKPIANPLAVLREEFDDWAVLFNPDSADAVGIDPVGVAIWKCLDGKHTLSDIFAKIKEDFSKTPDTMEEEINEFVSDLMNTGFVGLAN